MRRLLTPVALAALALSALTNIGCQSTQSTSSTTATQSAPAQRAGWPSMSGGGMTWSSLAYPTGDARTSAIGIEKGVPGEVRLNQPYEYLIVVTNLTGLTLKDVAVSEQLEGALTINSSTPAGRAGTAGTYNWVIGSLGPNESKTIRINATATKEGTVGSCASVTYNSLLCATVPVVQPALAITKTGPAEVLKCEEITYRFVVRNTGTGSVDNVVINDPLPNGLTTLDGKNAISFSVGTLKAGESKEYTARVKAAAKGNYSNTATVSATGGYNASSQPVATVVREPALRITKTGPAREFIGRNATYEITVTNTGDGDARDTMIEDTVPADARFISASDGGAFANGKVTWNAGTLKPGASKKVTVTLSRDSAGALNNTAVARAFCAEAVTANAQTVYSGIPALLLEVIDIEDPDLVGTTETYVITVTNQGSAPATNIRIVATVEPNQTHESNSGPTRGTVAGPVLTFEPLASLAPQAKATWRVIVKNVKAGDVRFRVSMTADQLTRPVEETESTNIYE